MQPGASFILCKQAEDPQCAAKTQIGASNHNTYFGVPLDTWWENECKN